MLARRGASLVLRVYKVARRSTKMLKTSILLPSKLRIPSQSSHKAGHENLHHTEQAVHTTTLQSFVTCKYPRPKTYF